MTVREDSAVQILNELNIQSEQVLDPTLLFDREYWSKFAKEINHKKYILVYQLHNDKKLGEIDLSVAGLHNVSNALCAIAAARFLSIDFEDIKKGLFEFGGVHRRFEEKGEKDGIRVIDDYAHHPTEIKATLGTLLAFAKGRIWCVFQPHTYTRTLSLFEDFVKALSCGINPIILDIYAAREKDTGLISSKKLADAIDNAIYIDSFKNCVSYLRENAKSGDVVLTMGAGDVYKVGEAFLND